MSLTFLCTRCLLNVVLSGEQGKVDESMREMAAIEALKSEKADKEVKWNHFSCAHDIDINLFLLLLL